MKIARREKVFGPGRAVPLGRNAKCRVQPTRAPGATSTTSRARTREITRAFLDVLQGLSRSGTALPGGRLFVAPCLLAVVRLGGLLPVSLRYVLS